MGEGARRPARLTLLAALVVAVIAVANPGSAAAGVTADTRLSIDEATLTEIERFLETQRSALGYPGMAVGVVHGEEIVLLRGFGEAALGGDVVRSETPFLIASLSKSLTALAVMQLVDDGLVDLDASVATYLPEVAPGGNDVTVRDLMHHRSGLTGVLGNEPWRGHLGSSLDTNVARLGPHFVAASEFSYSNANYDALALIVQRASGIPFADYMHERVFTPLDMRHSFADRGRASDAGLAQGHYHWLFFGYRALDAPMPPGLVGSATMFSSARDLTHVLLAHLNGGVYEGSRVVSEEGLRALHEPRAYEPGSTGGYAGGWAVGASFGPGPAGDLASLVTLWHDGASVASRSVMWMMPEVGLGFVVLANGNDPGTEPTLPQVAQDVKALLFGLEPAEVISYAPLLIRWGKHLILGAVVAQVTLAVATWGVVRRGLRGRRPEGLRWVPLGAATVLDLVAIWAMVWLIPSVAEAPLNDVLYLPDYRILIVALAVGVGWGAIRTALILSGLLSHRQQETESPRVPAAPVEG